MSTRVSRRFLASMFVFVVLLIQRSVLVYGQTTTGSVYGTVTASTGAVTRNATVSVTDTATRLTERATTNGSGEYIFPTLNRVVHASVLADWKQLDHSHISESVLPGAAFFFGREPMLWERGWKYLLLAIALLVAQSILIVGLLWQRARKRKAEAVLRESEERFCVMADPAPSLIWMCDNQAKITYLNDRWAEFTCADPTFPRVNDDASFAGFIGSAIDTTDQELAQKTLETVSGQLIEAQEKERCRIARDLHDDICQRLVLLSMELEHAAGCATVTKENLKEIRKHCTEIAEDVQSLSHQLHSSKLDYLGLATAVKGFCKEFSKQHAVKVEFTERNVPKYVAKDVSLCLFRISQEALHNAVKYSGTDHFVVDLTGMSDAIQLIVSDAGVGFDVESAKRDQGLGLVSMQERMHLVNGTLLIESEPGRGTRVLAVAPFVAENDSAAGDAPREVNRVANMDHHCEPSLCALRH